MSIRIKNWNGTIEIVPPTEEEIRTLEIGDLVLVKAKYDGENLHNNPIVSLTGVGGVHIVAIVEPEEEPKPEMKEIEELTDKEWITNEGRSKIDQLIRNQNAMIKSIDDLKRKVK